MRATGNPIGFGRMLRKEDARFLRGQGNYVDDVELPGMLHGAILRSPYAHARIVSIDTSAAEAHPKVKAVITGAVLETLGLAWMPTLSYDAQAVLATDKVRFQGQEVAFVVAEDRYSARDALELIDVEYEPLPAGRRRPQGARRRRPGHPRRQGGQDRQPHLRLGGRRQGGDRRGVRQRRRRRRPGHALPARRTRRRWRRAASSPTWTRSTASSRSGARPRRRTPTARSTRSSPACPSTRSRSSRRTSAAASATRSAIYPGYVCSVVGSIVTGKPVKWMEDRSENLMSTVVRPRLPHARRDRRDEGRQDPRPPRRRARRPRRVQRHRPADEVPGRLLPHLHRLLRPRGRALQGHRRLHEQGARRRRLRLLVPRSPRPCTSSSAWSTASPTSSTWTRPSCG